MIDHRTPLIEIDPVPSRIRQAAVLASHSQVSPIGSVELACQLADLLLEREP